MSYYLLSSSRMELARRPSIFMMRVLSPSVIVMIFISFILVPSIQTANGVYTFFNKWGTHGTGNGQFDQPVRVAADSSGRVYVDDGSNNRIQLFRMANPCPSDTTQIVSGVCFVRAWGTFGSANGEFKFPTDVALDSSGRVYVADGDSGNGRIQMFKGNGDFIRTWGQWGLGNGQFTNPIGVAVDPFGYVYTVDAQRIQKFQLANPCPTGTTQITSGVCFVTKWGTLGSGKGQFNAPTDIAIDSSGIMYVSEFGNNRIQMFTGNGVFIKSWGTMGSGDGQFKQPFGVAVDPFGYVYVADTGNNRIQKFLLTPNSCPSGTTQITFQVCFVTKWGVEGSGNGQFKQPTGVSVGGPSGHVFVADDSNNRIQEFYWKTDIGGTGGTGGNEPGIAANQTVK
jgi:tripartite motif-containing protein 71